jgi:hypothetical protein
MNKKGDTNMDNAQTFIRGSHAPDGIHEDGPVYFNEYRNPGYFLKRRAIRAFMENVAPFGIVVGTLVAFLILGYIEVGR